MRVMMIAMVVVRVVVMVVRVVVMMIVLQQPGTQEVHSQSDAGDRDRLIERDAHRMQQPRHALVADEKGNHRQHDRACVTRQIAELAGAEGEPLVTCVAPGESICQRRDEERSGMRRHVEAVRDQRHRAEQRTAADLSRHHGAADRDDDPGLALVARMIVAEENVLVGERHQRFRMHMPLLLR